MAGRQPHRGRLLSRRHGCPVPALEHRAPDGRRGHRLGPGAAWRPRPGKPFTDEFENADAGIPHNVAIYTDPSATTSLFVGEMFPGPDGRTYQVPPLDPGTYFFRCDVHPTQMIGTFVVA